MSTKAKTQSEFYEIYKTEVENNTDELTDFSEGSLHDIIGGAISMVANELSELTVAEFRKTLIDGANGPEVTGGSDDLEILVVDHFGDDFERPEGNEATVTLKFSRPNTDAGTDNINAGSVIKTEKDVNGEEISFVTDTTTEMSGLEVEIAATAQVVGVGSNVEANKLTVIETTLFDSSITVTNELAAAGGEEPEDDATYRETIRSLINSLAKAVKTAIEGKLEAVPGIVYVTLVEIKKAVKEWDIGGSTTIGDYFLIPYPVAYISDVNGNFSQALIDAAKEAVIDVQAAGVNVVIKGGTKSELDWDASLILDSGGPNYAEFQNDVTKILETMEAYINQVLDVGDGFVRDDADEYILGIWGPSGTGDLTAIGFKTNSPVADIAGATGVKLIAKDMTTS